MPGKPKHLGVPNGRMVSVGSSPGPRGEGGHTQGGALEAHPVGLGQELACCQPSGEGGYRQQQEVGPGTVTPGLPDHPAEAVLGMRPENSWHGLGN